MGHSRSLCQTGCHRIGHRTVSRGQSRAGVPLARGGEGAIERPKASTAKTVLAVGRRTLIGLSSDGGRVADG